MRLSVLLTVVLFACETPRKPEVQRVDASGGAEAADEAKRALAEAEAATATATDELKKATIELRISLSQRVEAADQELARLAGSADKTKLAEAQRHSDAAKVQLARLELASVAALAEIKANAQAEVTALEAALASAREK